MHGDLPADLLEELRIAAGCDYTSELPDLRYGRGLLKRLAKFNRKRFPLSQWSNAITYLTKTPWSFQSYDELNRYLTDPVADKLIKPRLRSLADEGDD